jgi:hypothetical protein
MIDRTIFPSSAGSGDPSRAAPPASGEGLTPASPEGAAGGPIRDVGQALGQAPSPDEGRRRLRSPSERPGRERLPNRRRSITMRFRHIGFDGTPRDYDLTIGFYDELRTPGEIFIDGAELGELRSGSDLEFHLDDEATFASKLLQHGERAFDLAKGAGKGTVIRHALAIVAAIQAGGPDAAIEGVS